MKSPLRMFFLFIGVLVVLLVSSLLLEGANSTAEKTSPTITEFKPSSTAALAELLRREGYTVRLDRNSLPKLGPKEIAVVFDPGADALPSFLQSAVSKRKHDNEDGESDEELDQEWGNSDDQARLGGVLKKHIEAGGNVIFADYNPHFTDVAGEAQLSTIHFASKPEETFNVSLTNTRIKTFGSIFGTSSSTIATPYGVTNPKDSLAPLVTLVKLDKGSCFEISDSLFLTNHFIEQNDNAAFALSLFHHLAPAGSTLVFTEASSGNAAAFGLVESLGNFAPWARMQAALLVLVVVMGGAIRFGSLEKPYEGQRGTREMVDAMAANLARIKQPTFALGMIIDDSYERTRIALKLPISTPRETLRAAMPADLNKAMTDAEQLFGIADPGALQRIGLRSSILLAAQNLDATLTLFEKDTRRRRVS